MSFLEILQMPPNLFGRSREARHQRQVEKVCQRLLSRNEVIREALLLNPSDDSFLIALSRLCSDIKELIFSGEEKFYLPLVAWKIEPIIAVCKSLVEINRYSRTGSRALYFSSQRLLFDIAFHLFSHPEYSDYFERDWGGSHRELILTDVFYDLAEIQNSAPRLSGDVTADGEWVSRIFSMLHYKMASKPPNPTGMIASIDLWKAICRSAAEARPQRLVTLFVNLRNAATSNLDDGVQGPYVMPDPSWYSNWKEKFEELLPSVHALEDYKNAHAAFFGGEVEESWEHIARRARQEPALILGDWKLEDVYRGCIQRSAFSLIAYLFALLAHYRYWDELHEIWYCSKPEDVGDIHHVGHDFFSRSKTAFLAWILRTEATHEMHFIDRHDYKVNLSRACVIILGDLIYKEDSQPLSFNISNISESRRAISLLKRLISQAYCIEDVRIGSAFGWNTSSLKRLRTWCEYRLKNELKRVELVHNRILDEGRPDLESSVGDRQVLYDTWQKTHEEFWKMLSLRRWIEPEFTRTLLPDVFDVVYLDYVESYRFCVRIGRQISGLDFNGAEFANRLVALLIQKLAGSALGTVRGYGRYNWILPLSWRSECAGLSFEEVGNTRNLPITSDDHVFFDNIDRPLALREDAFSLRMHTWPDFPWSGGHYPVVVYGFTDFNVKVRVGLSLYYELEVRRPQEIVLY